jgi:putative hydrolase of the HAD superfamily
LEVRCVTTRAVIFDLFGTLVRSFEAALYERSLEEMARVLGVEAGAFRQSWTHDTAYARVTGAFASVEANLEHICRALGASTGPAQYAEAVRIRLAFYRRTMVPRPDAVSTLQAIKARGLRLGLLSDCSCEAPQLWPEMPFAPLIDEPVFSCLAGFKKPDPHLYRLACDRLGVAPQECMYVADGHAHELGGASALGMQAVLIAVPGEAKWGYDEEEAVTWPGPRVAALAGVLGLLGG